jgi:hypothetical protein
MGIKESVRENPVMAVITSAGAIGLAVTLIWQGIQLTDELVMTHAEADIVHTEYDSKFDQLGKQLQDIDKINECRFLSEKIDQLEYQIYELERDNASADLVQSRRQNLSRIQRRFNALQCARLL